MRQSFPRSHAKAGLGMRITLALLTSTAIISGGGLYLPAAAQEASITYAVPAGPLGSAITRFGERSGLQILYPADLVRGKQSPGVSGNLTADEALSRLLSGSGLTYQYTAANTVTIVPISTGASGVAPDGSIMLDTITIQAGGANTEGSNSYTTTASTIGKTDETLRETPQSVTVITMRQIKDRGLTDLGAAMNSATGVTVSPDQYYGAGRFFARGFEISNLRIDGGAVGVTSSYDAIGSIGLSRYDRVEVLRGADGLFSGNGEAGGVISLVRKRPLDERASTAELSYSNWNRATVSYDYSTPLTKDGDVRARMILSAEKGDTFYNGGELDNRSFYAIIEADLGDSTVLTFGGSYDRQRSAPWWAGMPRYLDGSDIGLPVEASLGTDWADLDHKGWEIFAGLRHDFANGWVWNSNLTYAEHKYRGLYGYLAGAVDPLTGDGLIYNGSHNWADGYQIQADTNISGAFDLLGRRADIVIGLDYAKHSSDVNRGEFTGPAVNLDDVGDANWPIATIPDFPGDYYFNFHPYTETRYGVYARGKFEMSDQTRIILGARYGNYKYSFHRASYNRDGSVNWREAIDYSDNGVLTPFAAVSHDLNRDWTAYASVATIYQSQSRYLRGPEPGSPLNPITGRTFETGLKGELLGGAMNASLAAYYTKREGEAVRDPRYAGASNPGNGSSCCYLDDGEVTSRGLDIEVSGEVASGLQLFAGYTLNINKNKETNGVYSAITPRHLLKVWANYNLPNDYSKWTIGAGLRAQSTTKVSGTEWVERAGGEWSEVPFNFGQGGYAVADLSVRYDFSDDASLTLNINNVFDRGYYAQLGTLSKNNFYGPPREIALTFRSTF